MKFEGMEAAARAGAVPAHVHEQHAIAGPALTKRVKSADGADQTAGGAVVVPAKTRFFRDSQQFDNMLRQQDDDEAEKVVREAIERANRALSGSDRKFEITVHEKTKDILVKVVDTKTNETIREIPPKKIVDLVVRLCEIAGILFDEKG